MGATAKDKLLSDIASGVVPIPIRKTSVGKIFSYPRLLSLIKQEDFPAVQIGRRWYSTDSALSLWVSNTNFLGGKLPEVEPEKPEEVEVIEEPTEDEPYL